MNPRQYIVGIITFVLLIWGPIDHDLAVWGMVIRTGYLILIPTFFWFLLRWFWRIKQVDKETENRLMKVLLGATAGVFFMGSILAWTAEYHSECTDSIDTGEGTECVGDYVKVKGGDRSEALLFFVFGCIAFSTAMQKEND